MEERSRFERILGETAFVKVNGFVDLARLAYSPRTAHDFDQDLERLLPGVHKGYGFAGENPYLWGFDKRVIIAAHLDVSSDNYQIAFESAASSGFQMFLWAFAPGSDIKIR